MYSLCIACFLVLAGPVSAQDKAGAGTPGYQELQDLGFTPADLDRFETIVEKYREPLSTARAQVEVLKAQVAKALIPAKPDRPALRKLIKESLDVEGELRFAQIERQIELRGFLGEKRWKAFNKALRAFREWTRADPRGPAAVSDPGLVRTIGLLDELVP